MRDIKADYKAAYIAEYDGYVRAGRKDDARIVAGILREQFGHDVDAKETAKAAPKPENAAKPRPRKAS